MTTTSPIVVLGARGLVGSWVTRLAQGDGRVVISLDRTDVDLRHDDAVERVADIAAAAGANVIVLAAANASVEGCEKDPVGSAAVNVAFPRALAHRLPSAHLVAFSSEYVFGDDLGRAAIEEDATSPMNVYGRQKCELEAALAYGEHLICRTSAVYDIDRGQKNFVYQLIRAAQTGRPLPVAHDQLVTPTLARDLARFVLMAVDGRRWGLWHAAGPEVIRRDHFAAQVAQHLALPASAWAARPTSSLGLLAPRPTRVALDTSQVRRQCGPVFSGPAAGLAVFSTALLASSPFVSASSSLERP